MRNSVTAGLALSPLHVLDHIPPPRIRLHTQVAELGRRRWWRSMTETVWWRTSQQTNTGGLGLISTNTGKETKAPYHPPFLPSQHEESQPFLFGSPAKLLGWEATQAPGACRRYLECHALLLSWYHSSKELGFLGFCFLFPGTLAKSTKVCRNALQLVFSLPLPPMGVCAGCCRGLWPARATLIGQAHRGLGDGGGEKLTVHDSLTTAELSVLETPWGDG